MPGRGFLGRNEVSPGGSGQPRPYAKLNHTGFGSCFRGRIATTRIGHEGRNPALLMAKMEISQGHLEVTTDWEALTT